MISSGRRKRSVNQKVLSKGGISIKKKTRARKGRAYPSLTQAITYSLVLLIAFLLMASAVASEKAVMSA